jgi:hypothetical protein
MLGARVVPKIINPKCLVSRYECKTIQIRDNFTFLIKQIRPINLNQLILFLHSYSVHKLYQNCRSSYGGT